MLSQQIDRFSLSYNYYGNLISEWLNQSLSAIALENYGETSEYKIRALEVWGTECVIMYSFFVIGEAFAMINPIG